MTDDDKKFVREMKYVVEAPIIGCADYQRDIQIRVGIHRLITLLVAAEAMREKAEWKIEHLNTRPEDKTCLNLCDLSGETNTYDSRHDWTDLDWIAWVKRRIEG